ncbi:transmembrane protein adipocyte-associated 1 [Phalaenopsis equestris]|uniref:transmembrane protein adipocyte-associated 1 n=1 Tax=Phalaenopsis equestris TaxID=78828 RepID=UPI0009E60298|nr:transmembrane protein adipocyte-associated 1 [Phalaenopsis equestris]
MRGLEDLVTNSLLISPDPSAPAAGAGVGSDQSSSQVDCHGLLYNLSLVVPAVLFVAYLASQARRSFAKLSYGRSYVMIAYYALLWIVSVLNFVWCVLQSWQCTPTKEFSWNILSLCTQSGMLFLEVSLIAFLLQGNHAGDLEAFTRTFVVSGVIVAVDALLKAIYLFGFGVPLFIDGVSQLNRVKWGLWIVHKLLLTAIYGLILFVYHSKWRERLPARPTFYNYICVMFLINTVSLFSCLLMENGFGFGFWLHGLITICYHSFYLPLLYMTFLADFFQEEDLRLENVYYSEMKDAGFFDADWE